MCNLVTDNLHTVLNPTELSKKEIKQTLDYTLDYFLKVS